MNNRSQITHMWITFPPEFPQIKKVMSIRFNLEPPRAPRGGISGQKSESLIVVPMNGIEPLFEAYESPVLPLNYTGDITRLSLISCAGK